MVHLFYETGADRQAETAAHTGAIPGAAANATGLPRRFELRLAVLVCTRQEEQPAVVATRVLRRDACTVWAARPNGLQRPPAGRSDLQGLVDQGQKERAAAQGGTDQEALQGAGPGAPLRLPDADLQLPSRLQPEGRPTGQHPDPGRARDRAVHGLPQACGAH